MKDELGGGIITEFVALRPKNYSYMTDEFIEMKKAKGTNKCVIKKMLKFEDYTRCLFDNEPMLKSQQRFKSQNHEVYTENINKIALRSFRQNYELSLWILWGRLVKKKNQGIGGNK